MVLGHGSRVPGALALLEWVAARLGERVGLKVRAASLQFNRPTLAERCRELVAEGAGCIIIAPYFLFEGNHLREDIPEEIERIRKSLPGLELLLTDPLGSDSRLVEIMSERVLNAGASSSLPLPLKGRGGPARKTGAIEQHPIEKQSFDIIDSLLAPEDPEDPEYQVVRRVVHTTGDVAIAPQMIFAPGAVTTGVAALAGGAPVVCDVNMVATGVAPTASRLGVPVACGVADARVAALARREGLTRGAAAMRLKAASGGLDGAVVAVGNAPTALFEVLRLVREEGTRPALVVGVPVGFVGAAESKEALAATGIPHIALAGSRGGSAAAVAIVNALLRMAAAAATKKTVRKTDTGFAEPSTEEATLEKEAQSAHS